MIRIRGLPISDEDGAELVLGLRAQAEASLDVADRLERALIAGTGMLATDRPQSRALLSVLDQAADQGLREVRHSLREYVGT